MGSVLLAGLLLSCCAAGFAQEQAEESLWYFCPAIGWLDFEGDEAVKDGVLLHGRLGYDYNEWWTFEGEISLAPYLKEQTYGHTYPDGTQVRLSRLEEHNGAGVNDCFAIAAGLDALFHFTRWERLDPYLSLGGVVRWYSERVNQGQSDVAVRGGGGVMYHFNDEWAVRADGRVYLTGDNTEANSEIDVGVIWTWGAHVPEKFVADGGPLDSDGDGLVDADELIWKTDKLNPDTDGDGLRDGPEVHTWKTNPLDPDTDLDGLTDGAEVHQHKTVPTDRDTDDGGVADGHEVIEDSTDPLNGADDLMLFELNIQFDYDKAALKPQYYPDLDTIAKVLARNDSSTARIEGHADRNKKSSEKHNNQLSQRRAESVLAHLASSGGIQRGRLTAKGYGFSRPKAPNDQNLGNPVNRRVEVYIRGAEKIE